MGRYSASGSEAGATTADKNKIEAEVGSVTGSLINRDEVLSISTYIINLKNPLL